MENMENIENNDFVNNNLDNLVNDINIFNINSVANLENKSVNDDNIDNLVNNDDNNIQNGVCKNISEDQLKFYAIEPNKIMQILSINVNKIKIINESLIEELCIGLKLYCQNHNMMINNWFDDEYIENLSLLKKNNEDYNKLINEYDSNSFVAIKKL
jgi:hypothetical protein